MTQFVWLGGLFRNKKNKNPHTPLVCVGLLMICCQRSRLQFIFSPAKCFSRSSVCSVSQVMLFFVWGNPTNTVSTQRLLSAVIAQRFQHHLAADTHERKTFGKAGTQTGWEAEAKSFRPASPLMLLFLGSQIRHAVSKATAFHRSGGEVGLGVGLWNAHTTDYIY